MLCDLKQVILLSGSVPHLFNKCWARQFLKIPSSSKSLWFYIPMPRTYQSTEQGSLWSSFFPIPSPPATVKTDLLETTFGPGWLKWTFNLKPESPPSLLQLSVLLFHFSGIAHGLLALNHETKFRAVTLKLPITSPLWPWAGTCFWLFGTTI